MRFAMYTAASTAAAAGVVLNAFSQRANFYSATVHLSQTSSHVMILLNFCFVAFIICLHLLQLVLFGRLRTSEVEQLYDKSWYAVTETLLAMSIFRDDFDVKFLLLFAALLGAKCFHWINQSRIDYMEQTPPASPTLFHIRTAASFIILFSADAFMIYNSVLAVLAVVTTGRPNIMVMFAFEFSILFISCLSTFGKYMLSLVEKYIMEKEARRRKAEREVERERLKREAIAAGEDPEEVEVEDDEEEWELGGWEQRAQWTFCLDLGTDLLKLLSYLVFFAVVVRSYGVPLHILRDVYVTVRSFVSKIRDFIRYRRATAQMNIRYPDATPQELERDDVCIICREQIKIPVAPPARPGEAPQPAPPVNQRARAKKLPCGHIFHFACLRGWLERQSRCPTCRRTLLDGPVAGNAQGAGAGDANGAAAPGGGAGAAGGVGAAGGQQPAQPARRNFQIGGQLGGIRFEFGQGPDVLQRLLQRQQEFAGGAGGGAAAGGAENNAAATPAMRVENTPTTTTGTAADGSRIPILASLAEAQRQLQIATDELQNALQTVQAQLDATSSSSTTVRTGDPASVPTGNFAPRSSTTTGSSQDGTSTPRAIPGVPNDLRLPEGWTLIPLNPVISATSDAESTRAVAGESVRKVSEKEKEGEKDEKEKEEEITPTSTTKTEKSDTPPAPASLVPGSLLFKTTSSPLFSSATSSSTSTPSPPQQPAAITGGAQISPADILPFLESTTPETAKALLNSLPIQTRDHLLTLLPPSFSLLVNSSSSSSSATSPQSTARTHLLRLVLQDLQSLRFSLTTTLTPTSSSTPSLQPFTLPYLLTPGPYNRGALFGPNTNSEEDDEREETFRKAMAGDEEAKRRVRELGIDEGVLEGKIDKLSREVEGEGDGLRWIG